MPGKTSVRDYTVIEHCFIPLEDGRRLAARLWLPVGAEQAPVPAVIEYLPYRKRDATAARDESTYPVFAAAGYAGVRVDISGTGESEGDFDDEYSPRELADGVAVIKWVARQSWCTGRVGMMGISWGGFNSLQIAALGPIPLKAVISIGSSVDRYNDDIHYKNGCLLLTNFWWSTIMACYISRAPDPQLVGDAWRTMWRHRLHTQPLGLETWLSHPRRNAYWRHGSVSENYASMQIPALVISGWADGYSNAPPSALAHFPACTKAINGPWMHHYPHFAWPQPRMDFHAEALRWWERWLKDEDNKADALPAYRAYISENVRPESREIEPGRWVAETQWPSPRIHLQRFYPKATGHLAPEVPEKGEPASLIVRSPLDCGIACGEFFPLRRGAELPGDQRIDDAGSLLFETEYLQNSVEILGRPVLRARVAIDQPLGHLIARLVDIHPDGAGHRVSWGVLNLTHRENSAEPTPLVPGEPVTITLALDECGYRFLPGHKVRLSLSTSYWPMIMPPPVAFTATFYLGEETHFSLPLRTGGDLYPVPEPGDPHLLPEYPMHRPATSERVIERDLQRGITRYRVVEDTGESEIPEHGLRISHLHENETSITLDDPLSANAHSRIVCRMSRDQWSIRTVTESTLTCDAQYFYSTARVRAYEDGRLFSDRHWRKKLPRDHM